MIVADVIGSISKDVQPVSGGREKQRRSYRQPDGGIGYLQQ